MNDLQQLGRRLELNEDNMAAMLEQVREPLEPHLLHLDEAERQRLSREILRGVLSVLAATSDPALA